MVTVQELILLLNQYNSEGNKNLARKLRKYQYTQQELDLIERQLRVVIREREEKK